MSIFGSIMSKIFGHGAQAAPATAPAGASGGVPTSSATAPPTGSTATPGGSKPAAPVDVEANLTDMASKAGQQLNWKTSIVDLMKLLSLDSSLSARKELAGELGYSGDTNDSATMNIWLHKQVMQKLAENGGKVPESLKG